MIDEVLLSKVAIALGIHDPEYRSENAGILAAWSGGLDSTVLLHILKILASRHGFELFAAHLDHNLRPCSASDAAWCRHEAARLGIGIHIEQLAIRPGNSTQNQARVQRYASLLNTANTLQLPLIATAHHADDAIETALINFARGSSLKGFTALAADFLPLSDHQTTKAIETTRLIRPLLDCSRAELERYAYKHELSWREDPSNQSDYYERNRIRHHVIPELTRNSQDIAQLQTSLEHLREDSSALDQIASKTLESALRPQPDLKTIGLDRETIAAAPSAIITRVLARTHSGWNRATLSTALKLLREPQHLKSKQKISLSGATATFRKDCILIEPTVGRGSRELDSREALPAHLNPNKNGEIRWFDTLFTWYRRAYNQEAIFFDSPQIVYFDADRLPSTLFIRGPRGNERITVQSPTGRKRIKDLWNEHRIPPDIRWRWPILVSSAPDQSEEILWLCNLRRSHKYQISSQTRTILIIESTSNQASTNGAHFQCNILT